MRPRSSLFAHQEDGAAHAVRRREMAMLLDLGWGKTATTLTGIVDAGATPALIVAPARVAEHVWHAEAAAWEHTAHLRVARLVGTEKKRLEQLASKPDVVTVSYENLLWLTDVCDIDARFKSIVFDELSRMKTPGTKRFRRMRARGMEIPIRLGLTGSPVPNHLMDVWGELFMVAGEKPLGAKFSEFKPRYFEPVDYFQRVWRLKGMTKEGEHTTVSKTLEREIHTRISPWCYTPPPGSRDQVVIPPVRVNEVTVPMPAAVKAKQQQLVDELFTTLDSGVELEALQKSTLGVKLSQFASGAVYTDKEGHWEEVHSEKIATLEEMLGEAQGEPVLVFYWYKHELERLAASFQRNGRVFAEAGEDGALERWNARKLEVLLAHPASTGAGLNLQHGGHHVVWYTLPWAHWLWKQGNGRLARTGQRAPFVTASALLCGDADRRVLEVLRRKGATEDELFASLGVADLL